MDFRAREVLGNATSASMEPGVDVELRGAWRDTIDKLAPLQVGRHGQLLEYPDEFPEPEPNTNWAIFGADGGANPIIPIPPLDQDEDGAILPSPTPVPEPEPETETDEEEPADEEDAAQGFAGTRSA